MRGQFYIDKNRDYDKAFADFDRAIELDFKNASAYMVRGENYYTRALLRYKDGRNDDQTKEYFSRAKTDLDKAVELNPIYASQVAVIYTDMGTINRSVADLTKAVELNPNSFNIYFQQGRFFMDRKDYDKAIDNFDKAIEINPNNSYPFENRGWCYFSKQNYDLALDDYNTAIKISPTNASAYTKRAKLYDKTGKKDLARQDINRAARLQGFQE